MFVNVNYIVIFIIDRWMFLCLFTIFFAVLRLSYLARFFIFYLFLIFFIYYKIRKKKGIPLLIICSFKFDHEPFVDILFSLVLCWKKMEKFNFFALGGIEEIFRFHATVMLQNISTCFEKNKFCCFLLQFGFVFLQLKDG